MNIENLTTPALLLDVERLDANVASMRKHLAHLGVRLRPHVKTVKSIDVVRRLGGGPITVSTLKEAEYFLQAGVFDMLYGVGIAPAKLPNVAALIRRGASLTLILDSVSAALEVAEFAAGQSVDLSVLIELDVDGHRSGVGPDTPELVEIGRLLSSRRRVSFVGVMTHAGASYNCRTVEQLEHMAERERAGAVHAAQRLRAAGVPAPIVSIGSTPTATFARDLSGVTEVRAGVFVLQDLVMAGIGVCSIEDIALSVLVTVIGHQRQRGWVVTDGGWMALSRDRGTSSQGLDQGYGIVRDAYGRALGEDLVVVSANQEHGVVARRDGTLLDFARYPIGTRLRVLPNHACATGAQHDRYHVVRGDSAEVTAVWPRISGW